MRISDLDIEDTSAPINWQVTAKRYGVRIGKGGVARWQKKYEGGIKDAKSLDMRKLHDRLGSRDKMYGLAAAMMYYLENLDDSVD